MIHFGSKFRVIEERWMITTDLDGDIISDRPVGSYEYVVDDFAKFHETENGDVFVCFKLQRIVKGDGL